MRTTHGHETGITIDLRKLRKKLAEISDAFQPNAILTAIGMRQISYVLRNLSSAGGYSDPIVGTPIPGWKVMAPRTLAERPLRQSTRHFSSGFQRRLQQNFNSKVDGDKVVVGTTIKYAVFHQFGAQRGRWVLPARPMVPPAESAAKLAVNALERFLRRIKVAGSS